MIVVLLVDELRVCSSVIRRKVHVERKKQQSDGEMRDVIETIRQHKIHYIKPSSSSCFFPLLLTVMHFA